MLTTTPPPGIEHEHGAGATRPRTRGLGSCMGAVRRHEARRCPAPRRGQRADVTITPSRASSAAISAASPGAGRRCRDQGMAMTRYPWARAAARLRSSYRRRCSPRCTPLTVIQLTHCVAGRPPGCHVGVSGDVSPDKRINSSNQHLSLSGAVCLRTSAPPRGSPPELLTRGSLGDDRRRPSPAVMTCAAVVRPRARR